MFARTVRSSAIISSVTRRAFARSTVRPEVFHNVSNETFQSAVLDRKDKLVLVDFYAE